MATAKNIRGLTIAAALAAGAFAQTGVAEAGHRHNHYYYSNGGAAVAGAVAGAILGTALAAPRYPVYIDPPVYEERVYIDPPVYEDPYYGEPEYEEPYYREDVYVEPARPYARPAARVAPRQYETDPVVTRGIDEEVYYQPGKAPRRATLDRQPAGTRYAGGIEQGSPEWVAWCRSKYRSFDVRTGTYLGYDGIRKACVVR